MEEKTKKKFSEDTMVIGNKPEYVFDPKTNQTIATEPYLRTIMLKIFHHGHVYIKLLPYPDKLAKVSQIYELIKHFGVREIYGSRKFIYEEDWGDSNSKEKIKILLIKWEMIDRLKKYNDELMAEEHGTN